MKIIKSHLFEKRKSAKENERKREQKPKERAHLFEYDDKEEEKGFLSFFYPFRLFLYFVEYVSVCIYIANINKDFHLEHTIHCRHLHTSR